MSILNHPLRRNLVAIGVAAAMTAACGGPPELPPADTMEFELFKQDPAAGGLTSADQTTNVGVASAAVWLVSTTVWAALVVPRATFAGTIATKADRDGDDWVWTKTFPLIAWESELRARTDGDSVVAEMYISDLRAGRTGVEDFLWYEGEHQPGSGQWLFYDPDVSGGAVLQIDWQRDAIDDKDLIFTNTNPDAEGTKKGDALAYGLHETTASMAVHDEHEGNDDSGGSVDFSVEWDVATGAGKYTDRDGVEHCWDTLANGQVDISCP
jgi:hypothetical protein